MLIITPQARIYALRELARRAGVEPQLFQGWRIELTPARSTLWIDDRRFVQFPNASPEFWREIANGEFRVLTPGWSFPVSERLSTLVPGFVVPFANVDESGPLFRLVGDGGAECSVDLLSSIWLTLSRFEETLPGCRDRHGRFTAAQSLALAKGFLRRPIVDEYGLAFEQLLSALLPRRAPARRELRVKLSHDVDFVGIPFRLNSTLGHLLNRRNPWATLRDLAATFTNLKPAELQSVTEVAELARKYGLESATYWKSSPPGPFDTWYNLRASRVRETIAHLKARGVEVGVHPGYETFLAPERLKQEVAALRDVLQEHELGGRQHFLRWSPLSWQHWESCSLKYDSSVGFADHIGFRAGTCLPYRPWLLHLNREADLLEIPLLVMDATLTSYMNLPEEEALAATFDCIDRCAAVGGVFTFLWHNDSLIGRQSRRLYRHLLQALSGTKTYDWKTDLQSWTLPAAQINGFHAASMPMLS